MKRNLVWSNTFTRAVKRLTKKDSRLVEIVTTTADILVADPFDPRLKTHKLKGQFRGYLACSAGYDLRILFKLVKEENTEVILLETIGTHDEVY